MIDILRGVPAVVWLFIIYFGISIGAFQFDEVSAAVLGLGIVSAAYMAEIYRGGLSSVHRGQVEAAHALGLTRRTTLCRVVGPQAFRVAVPAAAAYAIALVKDTSIASTIGVVEITYLSRTEARAGAGLEVFLYAALIYIGLSLVLGLLARRVERALQAKVSR